MKKALAIGVGGLLLPAVQAAAQVVTEMSPVLIDAAIATGAGSRPAAYFLSAPQVSLTFTTPYLRLVQLAAKTPNADHSLATPDVIAPELRVAATPEPLGKKEAVVVKAWIERPDGTRVEASSSETTVDYAQSARHRKITLRGVRAVFPITALEPGSRFRFQMGDGQEVTLAPEPAWFTTLR
jgi:hypothetical protein